MSSKYQISLARHVTTRTTCRDMHVASCCQARATQHVATFSCDKMYGLDSVSCRVKWNLGLNDVDLIVRKLDVNKRPQGGGGVENRLFGQAALTNSCSDRGLNCGV